MYLQFAINFWNLFSEKRKEKSIIDEEFEQERRIFGSYG